MARPLPDVTDLRCPGCARALARAQCADPLAVCLSCPAGHRFFLPPVSPPAADTSRAATLHLPDLEGRSPRAVAAFWLSNPAARSVLNGQLADLLRVVLEDRRVTDVPAFSFCPLCGEALAEYEQPDIWVVGLRCVKAHAWASRGGRLEGVFGGSGLSLHSEAPDSTVARLVAGWLRGNPHLEPQLHESVRRVLAGSRFAPRSGA